MKNLFETQYNKTAQEFNTLYLDQVAHQSTSAFFNKLTEDVLDRVDNKNVLDLGCGAGTDSTFYTSKGFTYSGLDASKEMCGLAAKNTHVQEIRNETFSETVSYNDKQFGLIVSKYAMQTAEDIQPIYNNVERLLDTNGYFVFLVVHPFRQFLEKKKEKKDYFKKEIVESIIFDGAIKVYEPTHTLMEYLSDEFLKKFSLISIKEGSDFPASEQIGGDIYPTYMIITAQKK